MRANFLLPLVDKLENSRRVSADRATESFCFSMVTSFCFCRKNFFQTVLWAVDRKRGFAKMVDSSMALSLKQRVAGNLFFDNLVV